MLKADEMVLARVRANPGTTLAQAAQAVVGTYSITHGRNRVITLLARGILRSEQVDGRHHIFVVED